MPNPPFRKIDQLPETPASADKLATLAEKYRAIDARITTVLKLLYSGTYVVALPPSEYNKWVTNVFSLIASLNEYTRSLVRESLISLEDAYNISAAGGTFQDGGLIDETVDRMLEAGLSSITPNVLDADFYQNQDNIDFFPGMLQNNPEVVEMAQAIAVHHFRREPNTAFADMDDATIMMLLAPVTGHGALQNLEVTRRNYIQTFYDLGYTNLFALKELTDHLQIAFQDMTEIMRRTMGPISNDLFNNIFALQSGILGILAEDLIGHPEVRNGMAELRDDMDMDVES